MVESFSASRKSTRTGKLLVFSLRLKGARERSLAVPCLGRRRFVRIKTGFSELGLADVVLCVPDAGRRHRWRWAPTKLALIFCPAAQLSGLELWCPVTQIGVFTPASGS